MRLWGTPSAAVADCNASGLAATAWPESASQALRAVARGYAPSDTHPATLAGTVAPSRAVPLHAAAIRGSVPLSPVFADAVSRSSAAGSPAASATTTISSVPHRTSCPTTAFRDPSAFLREHHNAGKLLPIARALVRPGCSRWLPGQSGSGCGRRVPTEVPPLVAIPS